MWVILKAILELWFFHLRLKTQVRCNKFHTCSLLTPEIFYFHNNLQIFTTDLQKHSMDDLKIFAT